MLTLKKGKDKARNVKKSPWETVIIGQEEERKGENILA